MKIFKNTFPFLFSMLIIAGLASCKKDKTETTTTDDTAGQSQQSTDESVQSNESETALNDANNSMNYAGFNKTFVIAGATIDSVTIDKKIVIAYNGTNGDGTRLRTGKITVQLSSGDHWKDQNAVLTVTFTNYKVVKVSSGKSMIFNGTLLVTNVSGGLSSMIIPGSSVTHKIMGAMEITFEDGTKRSWDISRQRVLGLTLASTAYITVSGVGSKDGFNNVAASGTNRAGGTFYTIISTPLVFSSICSWVPVSGVKIHKGIAKEITVTMGVDMQGNPVTIDCPYGYKINWTNAKSESKQIVISY